MVLPRPIKKDVGESLTPTRKVERLPVPATPIALDTESKTAQIIAQIKADAYAAAFSSPEPDESQLKSLDESSDEDDLTLSFMKQKDKK